MAMILFHKWEKPRSKHSRLKGVSEVAKSVRESYGIYTNLDTLTVGAF